MMAADLASYWGKIEMLDSYCKDKYSSIKVMHMLREKGKDIFKVSKKACYHESYVTLRMSLHFESLTGKILLTSIVMSLMGLILSGDVEVNPGPHNTGDVIGLQTYKHHMYIVYRTVRVISPIPLPTK